MNKKAEYRVGIGASSILMIFIILSLTTLGVLSFASARADLTLTQRRQAQVEAYYAALAQTDQLMGEMDEVLLAAQASPDGYEASVHGLSALSPLITVADDLRITIALAVGDAQVLETVLYPEGADASIRFTVASQQLMNVEEWEPDLTVDLASPPRAE